MRFHHRRVDRLSIKLKKLEVAKSRKNHVNKQSSTRTQPTARNRNVNQDNVTELAETLKSKLR